jgi:hypothetical protein
MPHKQVSSKVCGGALAAVALLSLELPTMPASSAGGAGAPSPQAIIAALRGDPTRLPMAPDFLHYYKGGEEPISPDDREHGVIAYFAVAADYEDTSRASGIAYRVYQDRATAEKYWEVMAASNKSQIMNALGSDIDEDVEYDAKVDAPWHGRQPFKDLVCETYISTRTERLETARCYAQHLDLPVIVSGIRIVSVSSTLSSVEAERQFSNAARQKLSEVAIYLLAAGMARVEQIEMEGR